MIKARLWLFIVYLILAVDVGILTIERTPIEVGCTVFVAMTAMFTTLEYLIEYHLRRG